MLIKGVLIFIVLIALLLVLLCASYDISISIVRRFTNCDRVCAERKIQRWFDKWVYRKGTYNLATDTAFIYEIEQSVENIIGKKRFDSLCALGATSLDVPLLNFGEESGLQFVAITFPYEDDTERRRIETISNNLVIRYLRVHGQNDSVLVSWQKRTDLDLPVLKLRYSITEEQEKILKNIQEYDRKCMIEQYRDLIDTEDENDLT